MVHYTTQPIERRLGVLEVMQREVAPHTDALVGQCQLIEQIGQLTHNLRVSAFWPDQEEGIDDREPC